MIGIAFSTAALIIVLSVFNGLEDLLRSIYTSFDPQLKIEAAARKTFEVNPELITSVKKVPGVELVTEVIEDYAYVRYRDAEMPVVVRGVSDNFIDQKRLDNHIVAGEQVLRRDSIPFAIVGAGVQSTLSIAVEDEMYAIQVFYIRKNASASSLDPTRLYSRRAIRPGGVFSIEKNYDENYIFLPIDFANELFDYGNRRTSLEIETDGTVSPEKVKASVKELLGSDFKVLTNEEQHQDLYRLLKMEKLFTFMALSLLIIVCSINIFFSLMMLAIDKKKDVSILFAMGAYPQLIRSIFLTEGSIIAFIGAATGLVLGSLICWVQDTFGLVGMGMENAIVSSYPVEMRGFDFMATSLVVIVITVLASFYPASLAARSYSPQHLG